MRILSTQARRAATRRALAHLAGVSCAAPACLLAQPSYRIGPAPAWVQAMPAPVAPAPPAGRVTNGYEVLLVDRQEALRESTVERYRHVAYRVLHQTAVQDHSQIELIFDPSYERVTLHAVTVTRPGHVSNQLRPGRIRVVHRETQLDYQIFDGSLSLVLVLEDVRPGDVIEYSFTRRGLNPVYAGHYMGDVVLQETAPRKRFRFRLLWPLGRPLFVRRYQTGLDPTVLTVGNEQEYIWELADQVPKVIDEDLPDWYDPLPEIQLSDFATWSQVAAWGDSLFDSSAPAPAALGDALARIRAAHPDTAGRVLAAVRFVQDEVRYLGVEIGINSHVPFPPATVMRRRYGDCKDKALLLITMLHELGVSARPALVDTDYRGHIRDFHPSAGRFDHAIVRAMVGGRAYWLDPTVLYQRGDLPGAAPPYGAALVLGPAVDSLSTIPTVRPEEPLMDVAARLDLGDVGTPARMRVETRYRGSTADYTRASIRGTSAEDLQREYRDFYADTYPAIQSEAPPLVEDDEAKNEVRTSERYVVPEFWHPSKSGNGDIGTLEALELE